MKVDIILIKIHIITVIFQDQTMYVYTSFRGAKHAKLIPTLMRSDYGHEKKYKFVSETFDKKAKVCAIFAMHYAGRCFFFLSLFSAKF